MSYVDGFVIPVPTGNRQKFIDHARYVGEAFLELGALRLVECWGNDVPDGKTTDFRMAVNATEDETVAFAWVEWPDKATRDKAMARMTELMNDPENTDDRFDPQKNPAPFDGRRMIFGGFEPVVTLQS